MENSAFAEPVVTKRRLPPWAKETLFLAAAFLFLFIAYVLVKPLNGVYGTTNGAMAKGFGALCLLGIGLYAGILLYPKKFTFERKVFFFLLLGFTLQLTYMLYTSGHSRQYDTWSPNNDAHYDYALAFYNTWRLPTDHITVDTIYQFYHPPLAYFIQAVWMHIFNGICPVASLKATTDDLFCACQILSCFYTLLIIFIGTKIMLKTKLSHTAKLLSIAFICLFPRLIQLSGQLNNDDLSIVFQALALLWFVKWYFEKQSWVSILMTGLFIGLGMMAKMSAASVCIGIGVGFVIAFVRSLQKKEGSLKVSILLLQYVAFLGICAPLGLWFQVYTHVAYGLPYNFVFTNLNSMLFTGTQSWVESHLPNQLVSYNMNNSGLFYENGFINFLARFVSPFLVSDFTSGGLYCSAFNNYNILSYALRSSIFGEFSYWNGEGMALISTVAIFALWFLLIAFLVYAIIGQRKLGRDGAMALYSAGGFILLYLYLQMKMPYGCSMDFRYIVPIILPIAYLLGKMTDVLQEKRPKHEKFFRSWRVTTLFTAGIFLTSSSLFYLMAI
jgi:4-amino-4-deoxy-L-arabinose transferase-like glycosyltransferase